MPDGFKPRASPGPDIAPAFSSISSSIALTRCTEPGRETLTDGELCREQAKRPTAAVPARISAIVSNNEDAVCVTTPTS